MASAVASAVLAGVAVFLATRKAAVRRAKARPPQRLGPSGARVVHQRVPIAVLRRRALHLASGWELDFFAFRWTGIDDADAVTFNVTEC